MSSYITSILDLSKIITSVRYNDKPASQVLDPFSCLIRLCLLNYKPIGTKLSFTNNKIVFQEPDFLQSAKRWSSGDSRQHIHNLYNPIFKLNQWYDINTPQFIYLLNKSKTGLLQLLKCYNSNDSNIIAHSINYYIETINNILEKKTNHNENMDEKNSEGFIEKIHDGFNEKNKKNKKNKNKNENGTDTKNNIENVQENTIENTIINQNNANENNILENNNELNSSTDIYSIKLRDLWNLEEIDIIYLLLKQIDKKFNTAKFNNSQSLILSIEDILLGKDQILSTIVNKISTSL